MKILLDENLPHFLVAALAGHEVQTTQDMGWGGISNGELIANAEGQFEIFITSDKNLRYQQNLTGRTMAILELPTNRMPILQGMLSDIQDSLNKLEPGGYQFCPGPDLVE